MTVLPTAEAVAEAGKLADPCRICPRNCRVSRPAGQTGYCKLGALPVVASAGPHFGEEPPLVGRGGSGTIFLAGCNLLCAFCQNWDISHGLAGTAAGPDQVARIMLELERHGCENVNFVTPTHFTPWLMDSVRRARLGGLTIPIVWNCGGYESLETLRLLEGTVDIYMPDAKFWDADAAARYAHARDYPERMRDALREMQRQVGPLQIVDGVARRGLLVRHLVMPGGVAGTREILAFIASEVAAGTWVNVMDQYRPCHHALNHPEIARRISRAEYQQAVGWARRLGLNTF